LHHLIHGILACVHAQDDGLGEAFKACGEEVLPRRAVGLRE